MTGAAARLFRTDPVSGCLPGTLAAPRGRGGTEALPHDLAATPVFPGPLAATPGWARAPAVAGSPDQVARRADRSRHPSARGSVVGIMGS